MAGKLVILSGPSGAGKSTIVKNLRDQADFRLEFSVSATSRPKRQSETDGKDYYFLSIDEFKTRIDENDFVEWEEVYPGQYYGTLKSEIDRISKEGKNIIFDVDVVGGSNIKQMHGTKAISIFIKPQAWKPLQKGSNSAKQKPRRAFKSV